eukprot:TRINITY_DN12937_c0_g1_i1.p1 TRINITY_DN12937_c0_g1~~TRINITY_DN12937_c0_g1_i1.p1  ORF type:complete len:504 (+),score=189.20 TRINITY_DN12937_c0_g1_i1:97-1608(+)
MGKWVKPAQTKQHNAPQTGFKKKVLPNKVSGKVADWRGSYGWIETHQKINHPAAGKNDGRIYFSQEDVEADISGLGASVSFFVYSDGKGLGAMNVRPGGAGAKVQQGGKTASPVSGSWQPKSGVAKAPAAAAAAKAVAATASGGGASRRQKVGGARLMGKVAEWKGKYGWILPTQPLKHPEAAKHKGKLYFAQEDVSAELSGVGCMVSFSLYKDGGGLGAQDVRPAGKAVQTPALKGKSQTPAVKGKWVKKDSQTLVKQKLKTKQQQGNNKKSGAAPDKSKRTPVSSTSMAGTVISSRNDTVAFIRPDEQINHPKMNDSKYGHVYLHKDDVQGDFPKVGASVLFFVYEDPAGIGADNCQVLEQGTGTIPEHLKEEIAETKAKVQKKQQQTGTSKAGVVKTGAFAKKQAHKQKQVKKEKTEGGPALARERITETLITGEVVSMGGKFGWIKPTDKVTQTLAEKHGGKIYLHKQDIAAGAEVIKGSTVTFHVYKDASGLGAEECS